MSGSAGGSARVDLDDFDLGVHYGLARKRLTALIEGIPDPASVPVPACPSWSVHDVLSHLIGIVEEVLAGELTGPPSDEATAAQVAKRRGVPTAAVLEEWTTMGPALEKLLSEVRVWPGFLDVLSHEYDVRGALGNSDGRDSDEVWVAGEYLVSVWRPPVQVVVSVGDREHVVGGKRDKSGDKDAGVAGAEAGAAQLGAEILSLETTPFEAFRFRLGRRSRSQLASMSWKGDPTPVIDALAIFGPAPYDVVE